MWLLLVPAGLVLLLILTAVRWLLVDQWLEQRDEREVNEGLPAHAAGPLTASRAARRRLHRDLVLLLVLNRDRENDADADVS